MESRVYFDSVAGIWDELRNSFFSEAIRDKSLSAAGIQPETLAADIGSGTGFITEGLLPRGVRVIAIDESEEMLARMRRKFVNNKNVEYRLGSAGHLPLAEASVDYVFANMYLHHVEDPASAICEMVRALKPGGRLVISDLDEHDWRFLAEEQHDRWLGFKREEVRCWLIEAGLRRVRIEGSGEDCCATSSCGDRAAVSIFIASGTKA